MQLDQRETFENNPVQSQDGVHSQADFVFSYSKRLQDDLKALGLVIKQHEDNLRFLSSQRNGLDESILDSQVILGKKQSSIGSATENKNSSDLQAEDNVNEQICRQENSAASVLCQLEMRHRKQIMQLSLTKDTIGIVAKLGRVDDDNLSRLLSEYLGTRTMLAIVCKTQEAALNFETYDSKGSINEKAGLHGLGSSVGKALEGRFDVICLENIRPYTGQFVEDDLQKKLNLLKPRLLNGECPPGFLGFAVNMIKLDKLNLHCVTADGYGLRETLFYCLFGHVQVYKSRVEMMNALPLISDGAVSLDGGLMRSTGIYTLGKREEVRVRFPKPSSVSSAQDGLAEIERNVKKLEWEKEKLQEDIKREQMLLGSAKHNFSKKKEEFLKFVAQSSQSAAQQQMHGSSSKVNAEGCR